MNDSCPQCGARLHAGTTCAERLYRMVASGGTEHERMGEAFAQFALSHPMTYSTEALQAASELLVAPGRAPGVTLEDEMQESASPGCRWWRRFARRASCH